MNTSPKERLGQLRKKGVTLFPKLSAEQKKDVMRLCNEPAISAQKNQ